MSRDIVDTYCWIHGTYTKYFNFTMYEDILNTKGTTAWFHYYGQCNPKNENEECWHHLYYQFIPIVLVVQAACFYFPG